MEWEKIRGFAAKVGRIAVDAAPIVALLGRGSHPIAWLAAGLHVGKSIRDEIAFSRKRSWSSLSFHQIRSILWLAHHSGIGVAYGSYDGGVERSVEGTRYGVGQTWFMGPYGDPSPIVSGLWRSHGGLRLHRDDDDGLVLAADARPTIEPSRVVKEIASDCQALSASGAGVGILLDGPPGCGKSQALLHVADALGGRTLRASLSTVSAEDLTAIALALRPTSVIFDDIDRGPTDGALDAVGLLVDRGVAVLASSNASAQICAALLRDGRVDDHRTLGVVEPDVLERMAEGLELDVVERLSACTVAAVARYLERCKAWGPEKALAKLRPLEAPAEPEPTEP